ncbi:MAG TPA: AAA family ATPase, partial [Pyrinomonadaceae bacterium]
NPRLSVAEFYQYLATLFNIGAWESKSDLLIELGNLLEARHNQGLRSVLVLDEGHGLSTEVLEEIRLLCNFESDTAKQLQIVLTGQPELREVLNQPDLRQLKQRVALRCEITALPNVEETAHYISSRLKVAGSTRTEIFSPGAVDYIFRCSAGIPRNINNLCDNALLNGFASGATVISRGIIELVAKTFDMLPSNEHGSGLAAPSAGTTARIFKSSARAELWAAGDGNGGAGVANVTDGHNALATCGNGNGNGNGHSFDSRNVSTDENFSLVSPAPERDFPYDYSRHTDPLANLSPASASISFDRFRSDPLRRVGTTDPFGRGNNGQSL